MRANMLTESEERGHRRLSVSLHTAACDEGKLRTELMF